MNVFALLRERYIKSLMRDLLSTFSDNDIR